MLSPADASYLLRAIELARTARAHGNHPFGALLVGPAGEVLAEAENSVVTDLDCTAHAELNLIRLASHECDVMALAASTLYASTEPCAMCAGAIHWSGIGRLVYALAEERLYELSAADPADRPLRLPCREVLRRCARPIEILGPAFEREAEQVHQGFWGPVS
jgi:tRNA(Arg) A34 adenosine deaminase TadA